MDIKVKYSTAYSHAGAIGLRAVYTSVVISRIQIYTRACICITDVLIKQATIQKQAEGSKGVESMTELIVGSTAQGTTKNEIKIDVLLTDDSDNRSS